MSAKFTSKGMAIGDFKAVLAIKFEKNVPIAQTFYDQLFYCLSFFTVHLRGIQWQERCSTSASCFLA